MVWEYLGLEQKPEIVISVDVWPSSTLETSYFMHINGNIIVTVFYMLDFMPQTLHTFSHLIFTELCWVREQYYSHFTDEETNAQKHHFAYVMSYGAVIAELGFHPPSADFKVHHLNHFTLSSLFKELLNVLSKKQLRVPYLKNASIYCLYFMQTSKNHRFGNRCEHCIHPGNSN